LQFFLRSFGYSGPLAASLSLLVHVSLLSKSEDQDVSDESSDPLSLLSVAIGLGFGSWSEPSYISMVLSGYISLFLSANF
jgi:hypothetical protein